MDNYSFFYFLKFAFTSFPISLIISFCEFSRLRFFLFILDKRYFEYIFPPKDFSYLNYIKIIIISKLENQTYFLLKLIESYILSNYFEWLIA